MEAQNTVHPLLSFNLYYLTPLLIAIMVRLTTAQINAVTHVGRQCCDPRSEVLVMTQVAATATRRDRFTISVPDKVASEAAMKERQ